MLHILGRTTYIYHKASKLALLPVLTCMFLFLFPSIGLAQTDTSGVRFPLPKNTYPFSTSGQQSPLYLKPPSNIQQNIEYDPASGRYVFTEKVGELDYRHPSSMSLDEYRKYDARKSQSDYWREKSIEEAGGGPAFMKNLRLNNQTLDKIFGTDVISITPQGSAELIFGYAISRNDNPILPAKNQRNGNFIFKEKIKMNVTGSIGDKMEVGLSYDTDATFDFDNKTKLEYAGKEDEIIRKIEAGDVSFSLPGTLITGSQSLFGLKTELQFGKLNVTSVISHQRGESSSINVQGGAQVTEYEIDVTDYDQNRHFFLSHFFRDNYNQWLQNLPYIESQLQIQQIEVWVVNKQNNYTEARDIVALMDLAEAYGPDENEANFYADQSIISPARGNNQPASNNLNALYGYLASDNRIRRLSTISDAVAGLSNANYTFEEGRDYVKMESARPLSDREYTINRELGYISLNSPLRNDEILAVAFTYTYRGKTYTVGELSTDISSPDVLILKMLKGITPTPKFPTWDLMMKNVYAIGAYQVSSDGFILNLLYRDDKTGVPVNYLSEDDTTAISNMVYRQPLLKVLELDNLDKRNEPNPDGLFDYIEGVTINSRNGRIYFPLLEPFGSDLRRKITDDNEHDVRKNQTANKYVFEELYDSTQTKAEQLAEKNKFFLQGEYKSSSSSEIQLNAMNVPKGSVKVTAGGRPLNEGTDYTVDYTLGRVRIINQGLLESGTPIKISLESNSLFNIQTKTLLGTHFDYRFSENFNVGATVMNLTERPLTQKVNMGDEPISNTIWGLNTSYRTQSQLLTTIIDKLPFIETKQPSSISLDAEFAHLIPGQAKAIGKNGIAYIDDFEAAQTKIEMKTFSNWFLSSVPRTDDFFNGDRDSLPSGYGRAKLAWYVIDPLFYGSSGLKPGNQKVDEDLRSHYARQVEEKEIFPKKDIDIPGQNYLSVLNLAFYPQERGPYNFDPNLNIDGSLPNPESRWGGIMREVINSDFETSNIEFIEFWMMDPFLEDSTGSGGDLYFQLGEISEDMLRDDRKSYEGGLPKSADDISGIDTTVWGRIPRGRTYVNTFDTDPDAREYQDVGLDGLSSEDEKDFFSDYLNNLTLNEDARNQLESDPAADDYEYYLSNNHDDLNHGIFERYKTYNNLEKNSPVEAATGNAFSSAGRNTPDIEDINRDNTLNTVETFYQYHIHLTPEDLDKIGENFIVDEVKRPVNGIDSDVRWLQFRIPLSEWEEKLGDIEDFKSIRFMRMLMSGFEKEVVLRFATIDLVRGEWRRYNYEIGDLIPEVTSDNGKTSFEVSAVNIEENASKEPVNYVLPSGIERVIDPSNPQVAQLNEQSLLLNIKELEDGDARSVFKNVQLDLRQYKKLQMFMHAEALPDKEGELQDNELTGFIRIGSDYKNNYYEIEVPLIVTPPGNYDDNDGKIVWPFDNYIDIVLEELINLKKERNELTRTDPLNYSEQMVFVKQIPYTIKEIDGTRQVPRLIKVKGTPNLSNIRQIMIGVRNPGDASSITTNDGLTKSAEVWFNELRLTDFNNRGGWAANGRVQMQLADFGVVNFAGATSKPGFGSIEEKVEERSMEEVNQYDISSNLELGKFFPEKANVSIPFYVGSSKTIINPEYFPKDPDIKFKDVLREAGSKAERDSIKRISQDYTSRTSINVTNMRWNKNLEKAKILSPGNITASAGYSGTRSRNYSVEYDNLWRYNLSLNYVYNSRAKNIQPFRKSKKLRKPAFRIIRDFNFTPYPSRFTFGTVFDRNYQEMKMRNVNDEIELIIEPTVNKDFRWDRKYDLRWDLTRSIKVNYSATNSARIDEPTGQSDLFLPNNEEWKREVWSNIWYKGGRNMSFNQNFDITYNLPINKIQLLNWVSVNTSYGGTLSWTRGEQIPNRTLGNTLKNSNSMKINGNFNLRSLYSKVGYFKSLDAKYSSRGKQKDEDQRFKTVRYEKRTFFKKDQPKNIIHKLRTEKVEVEVMNAEGQKVDVQMTIVNENKITITAPEDMTGVTVIVIGQIPKGENPFVFIGENTIRMLLGFKSINASWTRNMGTLLPGYRPETNYFGISTKEFYGAPGFPFAFGWQDWDIHRHGIDNGWMTEDTTFSKPVEFTMNEQFTMRTTYEPFRGLRIDLNANRSYTEYNEQLFFYDTLNANYGNYFIDNMYRGGNFSISIISIRTAFEKMTPENGWKSAAFDKLKENRKVISARRFNERRLINPDYQTTLYHGTSEGYYDGYGPTSQDVLIPAFLSAYTGINPEKVTFKTFFWTMMPNWRITFDGLSKLEPVKKVLKNLTLNHTYKSTYTIGSFGTNVSYFENYQQSDLGTDQSQDIRGYIRDNQNNFISQYQFSTVSIKESMNPLIGIDMTWHNSLLTKFEISKSRMVSLSLNNNQVNETRNNDFTVGAGYRFKEVPITVNQKQITSDLNVRCDLSMRENVTIIRFLTEQPEDEEETKPTTGGKKFAISFTADYLFNENFNIQLYFDRTVNTPFTTNSYRNAETNIGFSLRLSL